MPARKDQPGRRARRACKACPALKGNRALKGHRVPKGHRDRRVRPAQRAIPDRLAASIRSVQANGEVSCDANENLVSVFCPSGGAPDGAKCGSGPAIGLCLKKP